MADPPISDDAVVIIAHILARGEAHVVGAALQSAGIPVYIGGAGHLSLLPITVPMGAYRIAVPVAAYAEAVEILQPMRGDTPVEILHAYRKRIVRLILAWLGAAMAISVAIAAMLGSALAVLYGLITASSMILGMHVPPPPWRGDYHLGAASNG